MKDRQAMVFRMKMGEQKRVRLVLSSKVYCTHSKGILFERRGMVAQLLSPMFLREKGVSRPFSFGGLQLFLLLKT